MVDMAHDCDDRRAGQQVIIGIDRRGDRILDIRLRHTADLVAEFLDQQFRRIGVNRLVLRRHDVVFHQGLDHIGDPLSHTVGKLLHRDGVWDDHVSHDFFALDGPGHLALLTLLTAAHRGE